MTHDLTEDFAYNPASQVTEYTVDITDYLYTGDDNLDGDYTVNGLNQYTDVDGESYDYDAKGNLTDIGTDDYSYDSLNRMTSALGVSLKYDPYGRLYEIDTGSAVTRFVYDGDAMVLELDGNNAIQGRYVHGPGVDQPLVWYDGSSVGATERRHLAADRQGSIIAVSTSTTSAPHINSYDVFGIPDAGNLGRFSYTGQIWLPEIGLMYYKARIYNPQLGRFMQTDPIGYDDQMNMYAYVGNDPMNATDPSGMEIKVSSTVEDTGNGTTKSTVYIKFTAALSNNGGSLPSGTTVDDLATDLESQIEADFSKTYVDSAGNVTEYKMDANIVVGAATSANKRHSIELVPHGSSILGGGIGRAPGLDAGNSFYISDATLDPNVIALNPNVSFERTGSHEFGHIAGLRHPNDPNNSIRSLPIANLMSQTILSNSTAVTRDQLRTIFKNPKFR